MLNSLPVELTYSTFKQRSQLNLKYMMSLQSLSLLRPYLHEAALWSYSGSAGTTIGAKTVDGPETWHWGWESLTCQLRGHILGHWLSASALMIAQGGNGELKAKADAIVEDLKRCQQSNGAGWLGPFPEKFMHRIAAGQNAWAPQYVLHKLLAGLLDMHRFAGSETALELVKNFADWFDRWTAPMSDQQLDDLLDHETGGMLEVWADLFGITGEERHRVLMGRYYRRRFFEPLLAGEDVLTNRHANTQIPEILGAARAHEVTSEARYRRIVEAFWEMAVTRRGTYCTGGGSCGEVWQPPFELSARLHAPHEHCTIYNMMRLADTLFRWTGNKTYADYWERNYLNAILAQQNADNGMVSYFLPLGGGSQKKWGSETNDFWCCHGTLMQAHANPFQSVIFRDGDGIVLSQYLPFEFRGEVAGAKVEISLTPDVQQGLSVGQGFSPTGHKAIQVYDIPIATTRPEAYIYDIKIQSEGADFTLKLRVPDWVQGGPILDLDGEAQPVEIENGYLVLRRHWKHHVLRLSLPKALTVEALPDDPATVAFLDGPLVLAGLVDEERTLIGDISQPATLLQPDSDRHHGWWQAGNYRTRGQARNFRLVPLYEVRDETYCVYFSISPR